jgi:hypothetical protein
MGVWPVITTAMPDLIVTNGRGQVHGVFKSTGPTRTTLYTDARDLGPDFAGSAGWA